MVLLECYLSFCLFDATTRRRTPQGGVVFNAESITADPFSRIGMPSPKQRETIIRRAGHSMERLSRQTNRTPDPPGCFVVMPSSTPGEALQWTQWTCTESAGRFAMARNTSRIVVGGGIAASVVAGATYGLANLMFSYALDAQAKHSSSDPAGMTAKSRTRDPGSTRPKRSRRRIGSTSPSSRWSSRRRTASSFMAGCSIPIAPVRSPTCMRYAATGIRGNRRIWRSTRIVSPVSGSPCWFRRCAATAQRRPLCGHGMAGPP